MPRRARSIIGGYIYHILNRANGGLRIFQKDGDYIAFERVLAEAHQRIPLRILAYIVMPNHWHFVVWPRRNADSEVSDFMGWLTLTHTQRWHAHHGTSGTGHLYQGRFKSFPVQSDEHFYTLVRYVERNARRANLVERVEQWRWSSLWRIYSGTPEQHQLLTPWPVPRPADWLRRVQTPLTDSELKAVRHCVCKGNPLGNDAWSATAIERLGLEHTIRPRGRPKGKRGRESFS